MAFLGASGTCRCVPIIGTAAAGSVSMQLSFSFSLIFFLRQSTAHIEWEDVFTVIDPKLVEQWIFVSEHEPYS